MSELMPWELLARYFADEIEDWEKHQMEAWINGDPEREKKIEELREIWEQSQVPAYKLDTEQAWSRLTKEMDKLENGSEQMSRVLRDFQTSQTPSNVQQSRSGNSIRHIMITAAAAAVVIAAALFAYNNYQAINQSAANQSVVKREIKANEGERATYILNDGSRVILHAGSRLEVPLAFNGANREVYLEGEAYFEVTHDASKPFVVHSENTFTRVLGTKFLVRAWPDKNEQVEVVVSEGKVALGRAGKTGTRDPNEALITRNQKGNISEGHAPEVVQNVDMDWYMGWTQGKLHFKDRPLYEIIPRLEKWYAIDIQTANEQIANKTLTAEIDYTQPMGEVLKGIALSLDLNVEKEGRTVTFQPESN